MLVFLNPLSSVGWRMPSVVDILEFVLEEEVENAVAVARR
jgi:hypothetical protein